MSIVFVNFDLTPLHGGPYTLPQLQEKHPWIPWNVPALIRIPGIVQAHYGCRVCIANKGLRRRDVEGLPTSPTPIRAHIREEHD